MGWWLLGTEIRNGSSLQRAPSARRSEQESEFGTLRLLSVLCGSSPGYLLERNGGVNRKERRERCSRGR